MKTYLYDMVIFLGKELDRRYVLGLPAHDARSLYEKTLDLIAEIQ